MIKMKNVNVICELIDQIINGLDNKKDYKSIPLFLDLSLSEEIGYDEIELLSETVIKIAKTKNRTLRHLEKNFWDFINRFPFQNILIRKLEISDNEELEANTDYENIEKKKLSRLLGLALEILEIKDDNSRGSILRRSGSLEFILNLIDFYDIPIAKKLFVESINSNNLKEQYMALQGLENYYRVTDDELEDKLLKKIIRIKDKTKDRDIATICLQILINAGIIDEFDAVLEMGDWKSKNIGKR